MNKRTTKWYRKNEAELMKRLGFKPTRNSGATWIDKADGQNDHCICELKSTDKASFTVKQEYLHTLEANAIEAHKLPVFAFQFINRDEVWLAIKESDIETFKNLVRYSVLEELSEEDGNYTIPEELQKKFGKKGVQEELESNGFYLSPLLEKEKHKPACYGEIDFDYWELECYDCKFLEQCKKDSKKVLTTESKSDTIMGKGKGDRVEAVSFMPEPKPIDNKDIIVEVNTDKIKQNLLARNKYMLSKQTEQEEIQERRRKEQRERNRTYWKRNSNKKE